MTDPAALRALAARLQEAEGPDQRLDLAIWDALFPEEAWRGLRLVACPHGPEEWEVIDAHGRMWGMVALTRDMAECARLMDYKLPGWGYRIDAPRMPGFQASVRVDVTRPGYASWDPPLAWPDGIGATARTVELAWTAALCLAKAEMLERNDG
jgi:hypothetical protein